MGARAGHTHRRWRLSGHKKATIDVVRNDINVNGNTMTGADPTSASAARCARRAASADSASRV
jgi:hypothetical protein